MDHILSSVHPSLRQLGLQQMEFYAFVHFTVNTFTDKEWGDGTESPSIFDPTAFCADQWVEAIKNAGMTGLILTCKHHDGFCLWPSKQTRHSVASSPFRKGHGDVVAEVATACRKGGIKFGVYLSPWDRNQPLYGSGKAYDDYFVAQLTELLTNYGDIFCVWFDGACGEGPNGKKQVYDWERYCSVIRALQPDATIHVCGPDIRWCGNEAGNTRPCEWSVVPRRTADTEKIASASQQSDDTVFRLREISARDVDLGSREILKGETDLIWYPAEVNTSIRPGWFYHASEDDAVKPLDKLIEIYEKSVGGNATFLLNIPPTRDGLFHETDVARLKEIGAYIKSSYGHNLAEEAHIMADDGTPLPYLCQDDDHFYQPDTKNTEIQIRWAQPRSIQRIVLKEQIALGQRIEAFAVDILRDGQWEEFTEATVIGYKKIIRIPETVVAGIRIRIRDSRCLPTIRFLGIYA
jgi:alpha-L-fucosidase